MLKHTWSLGLFISASLPVFAAAQPFPGGGHQQLVRAFYGEDAGLPSEQIHAIAITRAGNVLAATADGLVRNDGDRWKIQDGPPRGSTLLAPASECEALAGALDVS